MDAIKIIKAIRNDDIFIEDCLAKMENNKYIIIG